MDAITVLCVITAFTLGFFTCWHVTKNFRHDSNVKYDEAMKHRRECKQKGILGPWD